MVHKILTAIAIGTWAVSAQAGDDDFVKNPFADPRAQPISSADGGYKVIGKYQLGCVEGAIPMTPDSPDDWEIMKPSRHRYYGTPDMKKFLKYLSEQNGKLAIGDVAQAAGGPLIGGHASHETGLDADIRYEVLPKGKRLTPAEQENHAVHTVAVQEVKGLPNKPELDSHIIKGAWNDQLSKLLRTAAEYPQTERIFVTPRVKETLCNRYAKNGEFPAWLSKLQPYYGHDDHFHVRLACPADQPMCEKQGPMDIPKDDKTKVGCSGKGQHGLKWWFDKSTKIKKHEKDDDPSYLGEAIYDDRNKKPEDKDPRWLTQVNTLRQECQDTKAKLQAQIQNSPKPVTGNGTSTAAR